MDEGDPDVKLTIVQTSHSRQDCQRQWIVGSINVQVHVLSVICATDPGDQVILRLSIDDEFVNVTLTAGRWLEVEGDKIQPDLTDTRWDTWYCSCTGTSIIVRCRTVWGPEKRAVL